MDASVSPNTVLWLAFAVSFAFGVIGQKTHFCTMGAVADIVNMGDWSRMRMWLLAIGIAILGSAALHASGQIDLGKSIYRTPTFTWLSYLVGGATFGIGMVLASGCGSKTLIRIGAGNLKSVVVFLVLGLVAYMTMRGVHRVCECLATGELGRAVLDSPHEFPVDSHQRGLPAPHRALCQTTELTAAGQRPTALT